MEKKHLLLISSNTDLIKGIKGEADCVFEFLTVKNIHAGYSLALSHLPDVVFIDMTSLEKESFKNLRNFKSTHFLNRSFVFIYGEQSRKKELELLFGEHVDRIFYDAEPISSLCQEIEYLLGEKRCLTNYWKDSFMGLFNLLSDPVILLQDEEIVAMNDAFKKDFFVTDGENFKVTEFLDCKSQIQVTEILRNFVRGKHMKASTTTSLRMNKKLREARITLSKLDKTLRGQMVMMIHFTESEGSFNKKIGTASKETEHYFKANNSMEDLCFTKREKEIMSLLCKGYKTREISETLCISSKTIEKHRSNIIKRTHSDTILESVVYALNNKMIEI